MTIKLPLFLVSGKSYGEETEGVAKTLEKRFSQFRFGVGQTGSPKTALFAPVHDYLAKSYPPYDASTKLTPEPDEN